MGYLKYLTDETWAEFSALDMAVLIYAIHLHSEQKQPSLKLITRHQPLAFTFPGQSLQSERKNVRVKLRDHLQKFCFRFSFLINKNCKISIVKISNRLKLAQCDI